ncbi:DNA-processing protein DprA [Klenkia sp. LSe6-5]|uniref:DNA-processing protein DprA n=1 Tax=Klenkia sesuvii TaxID=3103137 RepID=A0ABU8DVB5_9ACTN
MTGALTAAMAGDPTDPELVRRARAWLSRTFEPGDGEVVRWVERTGPVAAVRALVAGTAPAGARRRAAPRAGADQSLADLDAAARVGARLVVPEDDEWPRVALHSLEVAMHVQGGPGDRTTALVPPLALWVRGGPRLDELTDRSVAVVGSRASTAYGDHVAAELAAGLAERGWTTVSGAATGIDAAAHRGALSAGAPTVAVLACGVDRAYPQTHRTLLARILDEGLVVSEWAPGCAPLGHRFLVRNRLIAALSRGTVVVEAAARSGSLATAKRARDLGRPVMAVPGPVTAATSVGVHQLLRSDQEVRLVTCAAEVVETVGRLGEDLADPPVGESTVRDDLSDVARRVLDACPVRVGVPPERLASIAGCAELDVLRVLPVLELHDLVERVAGGWRVTPPTRTRSHRDGP